MVLAPTYVLYSVWAGLQKDAENPDRLDARMERDIFIWRKPKKGIPWCGTPSFQGTHALQREKNGRDCVLLVETKVIIH